RAKAVDQLGLEAALIPEVAAAGLTVLSLLKLGRPQVLLALRMPAQVYLVELVVVGQEDNFRGELLLDCRVQHVGKLGEHLPVLRKPVLIVDNGREVEMNLVTGVVEVIDRRHAIAYG